jgi:hypothetical protein
LGNLIPAKIVKRARRSQRATHVSKTVSAIQGNIESRTRGEHDLRDVNPGFVDFVLVHRRKSLEQSGDCWFFRD